MNATPYSHVMLSTIWQGITVKGWQELETTTARRIILFHRGTPLRVVPVGRFTTPLAVFRDFDQMTYYAIGPHRGLLSIGSAVTEVPSETNQTPPPQSYRVVSAVQTKDGIPLGGDIPFEFSLDCSDNALLQFALAPVQQCEMFLDRIAASAHRLVAQLPYLEFDRLRINAGDQMAKDYEANNPAGTCSLKLIAAHLNQLDSTDKQIKESRIRLKQAEEEAAMRARQSQWAANSAQEEARRKLIETQSRLQIEQLELTQGLEIETKRRTLELSMQAKKAEILRTEEGRMSEDMAATLSFKGKELEVQKLVAQLGDKQARDVLQAVLSHQSGANSVLRAIAANQIGIKLTGDAVLAESITKLTSTSEPPDSEAKKSSDGPGI